MYLTEVRNYREVQRKINWPIWNIGIIGKFKIEIYCDWCSLPYTQSWHTYVLYYHTDKEIYDSKHPTVKVHINILCSSRDSCVHYILNSTTTQVSSTHDGRYLMSRLVQDKIISVYPVDHEAFESSVLCRFAGERNIMWHCGELVLIFWSRWCSQERGPPLQHALTPGSARPKQRWDPQTNQPTAMLTYYWKYSGLNKICRNSPVKSNVYV